MILKLVRDRAAGDPISAVNHPKFYYYGLRTHIAPLRAQIDNSVSTVSPNGEHEQTFILLFIGTLTQNFLNNAFKLNQSELEIVFADF